MRTLLALLVALSVTVTVGVWANEEDANITRQRLADNIQTLQPRVPMERALDLAAHFAEAGEDHYFDPKLLIAVSYRETNFDPDFETLQRFGKSRGEIGLMQCHGACLRFRPAKCSEVLEGAWCQIQTGTRYLAYLRSKCPGPRRRWLTTYATGRCLPLQSRKMHYSVWRAYLYYKKIGGERWVLKKSR